MRRNWRLIFCRENSAPDQSEDNAESDAQSDYSSAEEEEPVANAYQSLLRTYQASQPTKGKPPRKRVKTHHAHEDSEEEFEALAEESGSDIEDTAGPAAEADATDEVEEDDEDEDSAADPFVHHFADPDENELSARLKAISGNQWTNEDPAVKEGRTILQIPTTAQGTTKRRKITDIKGVNLKSRLVANAEKALGSFSSPEQAIAPSIFNYQDLLFGARTPQNADRLRKMTCLHALNHIFKTRDRVIKNNAKLPGLESDADIELRDQGFTRPKVLFLLETKQAVVRAVEAITSLCDFEQQENKKRFMDSFSLPEDKFSPDKPDDFRELFEGNDENEFRIGLKFTRKTMKLYSKFYNSDIIFASPLGLRRAIEVGDPKTKKKKDYDFLSSIEIVVMEQADATLMQNWEHAEFVFEHLNLQPKDTHGADFSRVRSWYLDGHASKLRQTIVLSAYVTPKINALYTKHMQNVSGRLKFTPTYDKGAIESLTYGIKQTFSRFDSPTIVNDPEARFKYFNNTVLPFISRFPKPAEGGQGVLVFIPSYLDFVRVRNSLVDSDFSYASISEYTDATDVRKARSHFMSGRHSMLLYTGRAHHFHRYVLRGVKRVVFYGIPENPHFYEEVVGFIGKSLERAEVSKVEASVRVMFSKWERMVLERVVGSRRVGKMIMEKGDTFNFV